MTQIAQLDNGLFIGTMHAAADRPLLCALGISHVVNLSPADCPDHFDAQISYLQVRDPVEAANPDVGQCLRFIHAALAAGGCVLLHCRMALSRSPCVAAAYLMWAAQTPVSVAEALLQVRAAWPRLDPNDADLAMLVQLELELAEHAAVDLPSTLTADANAANLRSTEPLEQPMESCEPEPESTSAQSPPLLDSQQPRSSWQAFAARWTAATSPESRQGLRVEVFNGCRQQLTQCLQTADQMTRDSRRNLAAGKIERAATLIRDHESAAVAALRAVKVSPSSAEGLRIARSHGWELALQGDDPSEQLPLLASTAACATLDDFSTALVAAVCGETRSKSCRDNGEDRTWIWTQITQHMHSRRLISLHAAYAQALDQRLSDRLAGVCTHGTAAAMAELELRRLQQTMCSTQWPHGSGEASANMIARLEALINDISIMEEPACRWHEQNAERGYLSQTGPNMVEADGVSRASRPKLWPLVLARVVCHTPCITTMSNAAVLQHNATLLLPDGVVSELGEFAAWFGSGGYQPGRSLTLLPGQGYAEVGMSCQLTNIDSEGLQSNWGFEWRGRLVCVSIPSLAILHALVEMLHQPVRMLSSSRVVEIQQPRREREIGEEHEELDSRREGGILESTVSLGDLVAATGLKLESALVALSPLVVVRSEKKRKNAKKRMQQNIQPVDQSRPERSDEMGVRSTPSINVCAGDGVANSPRRARISTGRSTASIGAGLVKLHIDPAAVPTGGADDDLPADESTGSETEGALAVSTTWRVSLNRDFVPTKPKTSMLPDADAQNVLAVDKALQLLGGQLQDDLRSQSRNSSPACDAVDASSNAIAMDGKQCDQAGASLSRTDSTGVSARTGVCLRVRKVVPVCLWDTA